MSDTKYWVWLATRPGLGPITAMRMVRALGSAENVYFARPADIPAEFRHYAASIENKDLDQARKIIDDTWAFGGRPVSLDDPDYPAKLKNISDPPLVLYIKGRIPDLNDQCVLAVVGTRDCTPYGLRTAEKIAYDSARWGAVIATGLAHGIDTAAVRGGLRGGGKAIGVIGTGLDVYYPRDNAVVQRDVAKMGALITEYPPGTGPERGHFPARNRILSGLSAGVVVVEAPARSGALITASRALEQGRDVFAVPGNVDTPSCVGSNNLIREGATAVTCAEDIMNEYVRMFPLRLFNPGPDPAMRRRWPKKVVDLAEYRSEKEEKSDKKPIDNEKPIHYIEISLNPDDLSPEERQVLSAMDGGTMHVDEIAEKSGLSMAQLLSALTMLELQGAVSQEAGKRFTSHLTVK